MLANILIITTILEIGVPRFCRGLSPACFWGQGEQAPSPPSSSRLGLSLVRPSSVATFTSPLAPAPGILLPNLRVELNFSNCKSGLIILSHPIFSGLETNIWESVLETELLSYEDDMLKAQVSVARCGGLANPYPGELGWDWVPRASHSPAHSRPPMLGPPSLPPSQAEAQ